MAFSRASMFLVAAACLLFRGALVLAEPAVPCFFIFGDSLSDSGNNNPLVSTAKANFPPYGCDFPDGPTGRFSNGRTTVDLIGDKLGLPGYIPAFPIIGGKDVTKGVNYASGSAGILNDTGSQVGQRIPYDIQLGRHQSVVKQIEGIVGKDKVEEHMNKCLYSSYVGSNDFMLNYFMMKMGRRNNITLSSLKTKPTPEEFSNTLISRYTIQLKTLYSYGARKVVLIGLGPLGCLPLSRDMMTGGCSKIVNDALILYNSKIKKLADELTNTLPGSRFIFADSMQIISPDQSNLGMKVYNVPCCGNGQSYVCTSFTQVCPDRNSFAHWDSAHPTEAANKVLADRAYIAKMPGDTYPMDIKTLVSQ